MTDQNQKPTGDLTIRTVAMPSDTNPRGDIFGGWLMSQMDLAGGIMATRRAKGRTATIAVDNVIFHKPVHIGNVVTCYADVIRVGTTSMSIKIEAWAQHYSELGELNKVTEGIFTYVAIDQERKTPASARRIGGREMRKYRYYRLSRRSICLGQCKAWLLSPP